MRKFSFIFLSQPTAVTTGLVQNLIPKALDMLRNRMRSGAINNPEWQEESNEIKIGVTFSFKALDKDKDNESRTPVDSL